jgi:hypothetical protein
MKREARILLTKATDSALLSIEHFDRPWDRGRIEAVLVFVDRAFELLLKATIVHKGGRIRAPRSRETIGFDTCVRRCVSDSQTKCLTEEEALTIQILNSLRDAAQHYVVDISEQQLYTYVQSGLTLFDKILRGVFAKKLTDFLPERVLPVSSNPPTDFGTLMDVEIEDIKRLVAPGARKRFQAKAKLRSLAIIEASLGGSRTQPSEAELEKLAKRVRRGEPWHRLFPSIRTLTLDTNGNGPGLFLRISKSEGQPVRLVPVGTPGAAIVAVKRVDELGYYSLNLTALASKLELSLPKTLAVVQELEIQEDAEYFKEFAIGAMHYKRYSPKALDRIKKSLPKSKKARLMLLSGSSAFLGVRPQSAIFSNQTKPAAWK